MDFDLFLQQPESLESVALAIFYQLNFKDKPDQPTLVPVLSDVRNYDDPHGWRAIIMVGSPDFYPNRGYDSLYFEISVECQSKTLYSEILSYESNCFHIRAMSLYGENMKQAVLAIKDRINEPTYLQLFQQQKVLK